MEYDYNILEEKFKKLPRDIQVALTSTEVAREIKQVSDKNGLLIDQAAVLFDLASYVLLGLLPAGEFVKTFSKEARVDTKVATAVAQAINQNVFGKIRASMQKIESERNKMDKQENETRRQNISALESAGGFSVEKEKSQAVNVTEKDRSKILAGLENPVPSRETGATKDNDENYSEPLVDHLLNASNDKPISVPDYSKPTPKSNDPYHEPIE